MRSITRSRRSASSSMRLCLLCRDCASNRVDDARKPHQHAVAGGLLDDARARSPSYSVDGPRSCSRPYVIFGRHPVFCEKIGSVAQQRRAPWGRLRSPPLLVRIGVKRTNTLGQIDWFSSGPPVKSFLRPVLAGASEGRRSRPTGEGWYRASRILTLDGFIVKRIWLSSRRFGAS